MNRRKELKSAYKQTPLPMGVYRIKNNVNGKIFVAAGMNLPGSLNSNRFQLNLRCHRNKALQEDWDRHGAGAFTFDVVETLEPEQIPENNRQDAVAALEEKWLQSLQPYGDKGYNKPKKS
ncbi:MAG: GIY-YIG nuclease family protein [Bacillota bacterium]